MQILHRLKQCIPISSMEQGMQIDDSDEENAKKNANVTAERERH
jgi:hypothetical protein